MIGMDGKIESGKSMLSKWLGEETMDKISDKHAKYWIHTFLKLNVSKVGDQNQGPPKGSLFNSYYTKV